MPVFLSYVLSFVVLGIYWNNHHHLLHATDRVNGKVLWANLHLLFWLSLLPFATAWMGENHFAPLPVAVYGTDLLMAAIAYWILENAIIAEHGPHSRLAAALGGSDSKAKAIAGARMRARFPLAFLNQWISEGIYVFVAVMWLVPDRRIESALRRSDHV